MANREHADRRAFQLERIILFSDAVFAIAITLLVIEIKVPELRGAEATSEALSHELFLLLPSTICFVALSASISLLQTGHTQIQARPVASFCRLAGRADSIHFSIGSVA